MMPRRTTASNPGTGRLGEPTSRGPVRSLQRDRLPAPTPRTRSSGAEVSAAGMPLGSQRAVSDALQSPGHALEPATRRGMESRFGHDFSRVRVHTDSRAAQSARGVNALAYTVGSDLVFGAGAYAPQSPAGQQLLAHELAHTIQQPEPGPFAPLEISRPGDRSEREADSAARAVMRGDSPHLSPSPGAQVAREPTPKDEAHKPAAKAVTTPAPEPQKIPPLSITKDFQPAAGGKAGGKDKEGADVEATLGTETEIKPGPQGLTAKPQDKFALELTIPITDKLQLGRLSFFKEASVEGSLGFPTAGLYPKPLSALELETSLKVLSLEFEDIKVPLGVVDLGFSGSALASASYDVGEGKGFKAGFQGEAEAKFKPGEKSPFFITAKVDVEKTYQKDGSADFKWSPVTWTTFVGAGFQFK